MRIARAGRMAYLVIPHLPVAVERRERPQLADQPVIIAAARHSAVTMVLDCSPEALRDGVRPGTPLGQAEQLCPEAVFLPPRLDLYRSVAASLFDLLHSRLPVIEHAQPGGVYLGLAGLEGQDGDALMLCRQQSEAIAAELNLATTIGVAANKFTAEAASLAIGLNRALVLTAGTERSFLSDFPVTLLPVSGEIQRRLGLLGLHLLGQLARLPPAAILAQFGWEGQHAHRLARGEDDRPLVPGQGRGSETAGREFDPPLDNLETLSAAAGWLVAELAERLRPALLRADRLDLQVTAEDGEQQAAGRMLAEPTADADRLAHQAEMLLRSLRYASRITDLAITLSGLQAPSLHQLSLWHNPREEAAEAQLGRLVARYGQDCFQRGVLVDPTHRLAGRRFVRVGFWQQDGAGF